MSKNFIITAIFVAFSILEIAAQTRPYGLTTDLIERTDRVYVNGYPSDLTLGELPLAIEDVQYVKIASQQPMFGWIVDGGTENDVMQKSYRIIVSDNANDVNAGAGNIWDSGDVESRKSSAVRYEGKTLNPKTVYYWRVKTIDNKGHESDWSEIKSFITADEMKQYDIAYEPLMKTNEYPVSITKNSAGNQFFDFGKASFGQLSLTLSAKHTGDSVIVHLGERINNGQVERNPAGTTRYRRAVLKLQEGIQTYQLKIRPDMRNTHGAPDMTAVLMPGYVGEVIPFRYVEVEGYEKTLGTTDVVRATVHHPFNDYAADFNSSDTVLNKVWELCKYSMKATSFIGYHVDGDRERIPYECDSYMNQLTYYTTDRVYSLSRRTEDQLLKHPTWPTEWILQTILIAYADYLYTGDNRLIEAEYELLKNHTLLALQGQNGLISTRTKEQTAEFLQSIKRAKPGESIKGRNIRDIVDWPQGKKGNNDFGFGQDVNGESDGFEFTDYNTVVNAYHYQTLVCMSEIAAAIGKSDDAAMWQKEAARVKKQFNALLFNPKTNNYRDGIGTDHSALHSNMFPLAFGMVPEKYKDKVADFIATRGFACSIGNTLFLLNGMYDNYRADYALKMMTKTDSRSYYNTIRAGSTITFEAWDDKYKRNQDWNHAWGAVAANVIQCKLLGIEPMSAAWETIRIRPQTSALEFASGRFPTIKGDIIIDIKNDGKTYTMQLTLPANTTSTVYVPIPAASRGTLSIDGKTQKAKKDASGKFFVLENVGSGTRTYAVQ